MQIQEGQVPYGWIPSGILARRRAAFEARRIADRDYFDSLLVAHLRRHAPPLLCGVVCLSLLAAWQGSLLQRAPASVMRVGVGKARLVLAERGVGPYYTYDTPEQAAVLVLGDSRMRDGINPERLASTDLGETAVVWGYSSQLDELLPAAGDYPARRVLVGLSPASAYSETNPLIALLLARGTPEIEDGDVDAGLAAWAEAARGDLIASGYDPKTVDMHLENAVSTHRAELIHRRLSTAGIDEMLASRADRLRTRYVRTIGTDHWHEDWSYPVDANKSNADYRRILRPATRLKRREALGRIAGHLAAMKRAGIVVVCVRMPVAPELRPIEEAAFPSQLFVDLCRVAEVPLLDYFREPYATYDGSHMQWSEAARFTGRLAEDLALVPGW